MEPELEYAVLPFGRLPRIVAHRRSSQGQVEVAGEPQEGDCCRASSADLVDRALMEPLMPLAGEEEWILRGFAVSVVAATPSSSVGRDAPFRADARVGLPPRFGACALYLDAHDALVLSSLSRDPYLRVPGD